MIFIDTAALIGRYLKRDQHHSTAVRYWSQLEAEGPSLFTSNFVLDEALALLARRTGNIFAAERLKAINLCLFRLQYSASRRGR